MSVFVAVEADLLDAVSAGQFVIRQVILSQQMSAGPKSRFHHLMPSAMHISEA